MKKHLLELLICPTCLPQESALHPEISLEHDGDIETGNLICTQCNSRFPIRDGVAFLTPSQDSDLRTENKYETDEVVSSYLWSHYGELLKDENASKAYSVWSDQIEAHGGIGLDAGGAVGRFTFEMSTKCDFAIGIDTSVAFIQTARQLMKEGQRQVHLKDEGLISKEVTLHLPKEWRRDKVEFLVADVLALPFRKKTVSSFSSLNLVDKVPSPIRHLLEMNRVTKEGGVQFLLSDPFSWSTEAADIEEWLGGKNEGLYTGKGIENIKTLLEENGEQLGPLWQVQEPDSVWWKIRTHTNHYELIQSCFIKASR